MQRITEGNLRLLTSSDIYHFPALPPSSPSELKAELRVVKDVFWIRLFTMGDLGFSEAYMYGEVECDNLIFLLNRHNLSNMDSYTSYLFSIPQKLTSWRFLNTISNSQSNISAHYDISNAMFAGKTLFSTLTHCSPLAGFLSEDMTYSCAIFEDLDGDLATARQKQSTWSEGQLSTSVNTANGVTERSSPLDNTLPRDELHDAQVRKLNHIIAKARITPDQKVLEIGSGWGSMAILIAQRFPGTTVDTLTLSVHQQILAQARIKKAGLEGRVTVHLMDYRAMPSSWRSSFDRVISIEMIENVGVEFMVDYWRIIDWSLKSQGGIGVVQVITIPEARLDRYIQEVDFIRKWVLFPGGFLPTLTMLLQTMEKGSSGRLIVDSVCNVGPHYARTLREWRTRFIDRFETVIVPALKAEHPAVMNGPHGREEIEVFKRKWLCDCYCEAGFAARVLGDHILTFTREGCEGYGCDVLQ
ncbi:CFS1-like protein [Paxillus ammoniavirescens]|nr:CFS1-like protein [Paxillus ammoniavirescens]